MHTEHTDPPLGPALLNGLRGRCPSCGGQPLLHSYLKVREGCSDCGLEYRHHRADDGPPYLTILLVGHLMAPIMHVTYTQFRPEPWVFAVLLVTSSVALSLALLPKMKGLIIAFQWAKGMGGFGGMR